MPINAVSILAGKPLGAFVAKKFGSFVVEKWTRYRAESFYLGFIEALSLELRVGVEQKEVEEKLDAILSDQKNSEILFDAYRSVCFSKSREIGPRVIGLLTGMLILENRVSGYAEEQVFKAAEQLSDLEFYDFFKNYRGYVADVGKPRVEGRFSDKHPYFKKDVLVLPWDSKTRDSTWSSGAKIDTSPIDLNKAFGSWAVSLGHIGIITTRVVHEQLYKHSRPGGDELMTTVKEKFDFTVYFHGNAKTLADLVERALPTTDQPCG